MSRELVDSGVYYLGKIPYNWKKGKYKNFSSSRMGETILSSNLKNEGVPVYSATQEDKIFGFITNPNLILKKGDIVIPARGNSIGYASFINDEIATCTQTTICSKNIHDIDNKFYYYSILGLRNEWYRYDGSAIPQITVEQVKNNILCLPPKDEQRKISIYLDKKCKKIDEIIRDNNRQIYLLEEYKKSLIKNLLMLGFNKDYKIVEPSYIGKIASHWSTTKLGHVFYIKKNIAGKEGYDVLSITQKGIKIKDIASNEGQLAADYSNYQLVSMNDFAMNHMDLLTGWVDISKYNGVTSPDYRVFNIKDETKSDRRYYRYLMQLFYMEKIFYGFGQGVSNLGRWRLPKEQFLNMIIPIPPINEQREISNYLDKKCSKLEEVIEYRKQIIEKLEEYKKSLIYEVVTGKKEV